MINGCYYGFFFLLLCVGFPGVLALCVLTARRIPPILNTGDGAVPDRCFLFFSNCVAGKNFLAGFLLVCT
ncbi:hypothetical protein FN846DRAFT_976318 [Sphaerosporella brunnea]|uniref:Uncharacterized protein n=1 Tax=Sphaerosporella brunnea TaxID=1250544 RepID=A0A5J5EGF7_9PEZI|nr:hypothetical protein FN846DRAFT_976318 [Sphaerosporella brunnea]